MISDIIRRDVRNPHVNELVTVTRVDITKDLHYAKVYISVIGTAEQKEETLEALQSAAGFIAVQASKEVVMRYFPALTFKIDDSVEKHMRIEELLGKIAEEKGSRGEEQEPSDDKHNHDFPVETASGILLVNKPKNKTSFSLVGALRRLLKVKKIGHAGTLDPFATGVMVMLVGKQYTKLSDTFLCADKEYAAVFILASRPTRMTAME